MKLITMAAAAAAALVATAGSAATFSIPLTFTNGVYTGHFGDTVTGKFTDTFVFKLPTTGKKSSFQVGSTAVDMDSEIMGFKGYLDTSKNAFKFNSVTDPDDGSITQSGRFSLTSLKSGSHSLTFSGFVADATSLSGTITIRAGAVPEPATWAMMIGGLGLVGGMMRSARRSEERFTRKLRKLADA